MLNYDHYPFLQAHGGLEAPKVLLLKDWRPLRLDGPEDLNGADIDQHSPLAHTQSPDKPSGELSALPTQGSPVTGPPLSAEPPLSSSGGWRPPKEIPAHTQECGPQKWSLYTGTHCQRLGTHPGILRGKEMHSLLAKGGAEFLCHPT